MTLTPRPRIIGALMGNIRREPGARTKYGLYFDALLKHYEITDVVDAKLHGFDRYLSALISFSSDQRFWRERYYKNIFAFKLRSKKLAQKIKKLEKQADLILQIGVLFDAGWSEIQLPRIIYTDYTAYLASKSPLAGRSPFNRYELREWIALEKGSMESAVHIFTRSEMVRNSIIKDYGIPPGQVTTVGGGVNFCPLPTPVDQDNSQKTTALFIGKELFRKGGDLLLNAFARTRKSVPDARLLFLTADPIPSELPLNGVEVIKPTWKRESIAALYRRSHFLVLPSRLETWGDVLLEALGYGLPCIGVCGQAMEEVIDDHENGLIVHPENVQALAEAMTSLFQNTQLRKCLGQAAREKAEAEFTWERVVDRSIPVINDAVKMYYRLPHGV